MKSTTQALLQSKMLPVLFCLLLISNSHAVELTGRIDLELRQFDNSHTVTKNHQFHTSLSGDLALYHAWRDGLDSLSFKAFSRYDQYDDQRSHHDIRELLWTHVGDQFESRIGINKVFWGVTESQHLVDVINQTDLVERIDGEQKLGQPMINISVTQDWGIVDFFVLPYFRERTFSGQDGRFFVADGLPLLTDNIEAVYESSDQQKHIDGAIRWAHTLGDIDLALSYFKGTDRQPQINVADDGQSLQGYYAQQEQLSLEYQHNIQDWIFKFEGVYRENTQQDYFAAVAGFEYTFYGVMASNADVGVLLEYNYDERDSADTFLQDDSFIGTRIALNDSASSSILAGVIVDNDLGTRLWSVEASRRIADNFKVHLETKVFSHVDADDISLFQFRNDDYVEARVEFFF